MLETHPYTLTGCCPCNMGTEAPAKALKIWRRSSSLAHFVDEMEAQRVIGKSIALSEDGSAVLITKRHACEDGGGCPANKSLVGERCHCDHYNHSAGKYPRHYCQCGAEFYRPMFAPIFGAGVEITPYSTVLSGDEECVIAVWPERKAGYDA